MEKVIDINNANSPANPTLYMDQENGSGELYCNNNGLTKREAFAMSAMQNILSQYNPFEQGSFDSSDYDTVVQNSWGLADAMLKYGDKK